MYPTVVVPPVVKVFVVSVALLVAKSTLPAAATVTAFTVRVPNEVVKVLPDASAQSPVMVPLLPPELIFLVLKSALLVAKSTELLAVIVQVPVILPVSVALVPYLNGLRHE